MRDTSKDSERIDRIWRWIHNNIPGEPSTDDDIADVVIRLLAFAAGERHVTMLKTDGGPLTEVERPTKKGDPRTVPIGVSRAAQGIKLRYGQVPVDGDYLGYYSYEWDGGIAHWHPRTNA